MNVSLLKALRVVERADSGSVRTLLFARLAGRSRAVRLARWATHGPLRGTRPAALLISAYAAATSLRCLDAPAPGKLWALALYENERRQVGDLARCVGAERISLAQARAGLLWSRPLRVVLRALCTAGGGRFVRAVHRFGRRRDFLVACRLASTLACAMLSSCVLAMTRVRGVLVASDYNAEAVGLCWAARRAGVPTIFVSHSHTHALSPPLDFTLAILEGEAAREAYAGKGEVSARVVFKGVEGETRPLDPGALARESPTIGLFLPKEVAWPTLAAIVADARRAWAPRRLLVRWHPSMLERPRLESVLGDLRGVEVCAPGAPLPDDARRCDWVVADESSGVFLGVLKAGVPALAIRGLAIFPDDQRDLFGFAANGIVPPAFSSLAEVRRAALMRFFSADWRERFRRYDASYLRSRASLDQEVGAAVRAVIG